MTTITFDDHDVSLLSVKEAAEQLMNPRLDRDEKIGSVELEYGCDLSIEIRKTVEDDPRCSDYHDRFEVLTISDIRDDFVNAEFVCWAKDEDGNDVLACFGY